MAAPALTIYRRNEAWNPSRIPEISNGTGFWIKPQDKTGTFQESTAVTLSQVGDVVGAQRTLGQFVGSFAQAGLDTLKPLVATINGRNALHMDTVLKILNGSNGILGAQNALIGQSFAFVFRNQSSLAAAARMFNVTLNGAGGTKFTFYIEVTTGAPSILTRCNAGDTQAASAGVSTVVNTHYICVCGVRYPDATKSQFIDINGVNVAATTPGWTGTATCEALNAAAFTLFNAASPPTGAMIGEFIWVPRFFDTNERIELACYLNDQWKIY